MVNCLVIRRTRGDSSGCAIGQSCGVYRAVNCLGNSLVNRLVHVNRPVRNPMCDTMMG